MELLNEYIFKQYGFELSNFQLNQFGIYLKELNEWNKKINLTSITGDENVVVKHFVDSLGMVKVFVKYNVNPDGLKVVDIGTGAGFPGIPIKIVYPDIELTLIESIHKKTFFLKHIITKLNLTNCQILNSRAEILSKEEMYKEKYDIATARAVVKTSEVIKLCLPLIKSKGKVVLYCTSLNENEQNILDSILTESGFKIRDVINNDIKSSKEMFTRRLVVITNKLHCT